MANWSYVSGDLDSSSAVYRVVILIVFSFFALCVPGSSVISGSKPEMETLFISSLLHPPVCDLDIVGGRNLVANRRVEWRNLVCAHWEMR